MFPGQLLSAPDFEDVQSPTNAIGAAFTNSPSTIGATSDAWLSSAYDSSTPPPPNPVDTVLTPTPQLDSSLHPNGDFLGQGNSDILWENDSGDIVIWNLASSTGTFSTAKEYGIVTSNWQFQQIADVTGDGRADVIWRDSTDNEIGLWLNNPNVEPAAFTYQNLGYVSSDWHLVGSANFTGGVGPQTDSLLWQNDNGEVGLWNFAGGSGLASYTTQYLGTVPTSMAVQAVGHFGGDEIGGILWRDTSTGDLVLWYQLGTGEPEPPSFGSKDLGVISPDWQIQGIGDFNGDGLADILWRNTTNGDVALWNSDINSSYAYTQQDLGIVPLDWHIQQVGDFNGVGNVSGEGSADILWRNSTDGDVVAWYSEGSGTPGTVAFTFNDFGPQALSWHVESNWLGT